MQPVSYGGQAVLEGVMIRGPRGMAVACRRPSGEIVIRTQELGGAHAGPLRRLPLLRGVLALWETLSLGMRALNFSSRVALSDPDDGDAELPDTVFWGSIALAVAFIGAVFFATPSLLTHLLGRLDAGRLTLSLVEGAVRVAVLVGYIAAIGFVPGIRRVFQYHGAEHMAVHAHEAGAPLTVASVRRFAKEHTRCVTSFLLVVMLTSLLTFIAFDLLVDPGLLAGTASRLLLIVPIAAVAYEILRLGARFDGNRLVRALFAPNIALQYLTTRVPDDTQIEVALASLDACAALIPAPVAADAELLPADAALVPQAR